MSDDNPIWGCNPRKLNKTKICSKCKHLKRRVEALEQLLICYRVGKLPSETLHRKLEKTKQALGDT